MNKGWEIALREMCRRVGVRFENINFYEEGWSNKYSWTWEEEADFVRWLVDQIMRDKEVREGLLRNPTHVTENIAEKAAKEFVFEFGWRHKRTDRGSDKYE
ncbi:MAG: hypothetical protein ACTSX6_04005 [Candidatus Heimdallarchaeaceae archaeon]